MTMQQSRAAAPARLRAFGALPPTTTSMTPERALELAGVDETELALLGSTTFRHAESLEQLVTLIATTRRRGLDGLIRHVYFEQFGGSNQPASLHVAIDGLRAIAANTGRFGGKLEPRFSGQWTMPLEGGGNKVVPEKCVVTVYAIVQGQKCAFEGVAWMPESYPGSGGRGRMWRERPRGMLAVAAERQALRTAFPSETSGLADLDEGVTDAQNTPPTLAPTPPRRPAGTAEDYTRVFGAEDEQAELNPAPPPAPDEDDPPLDPASAEQREAEWTASAVGVMNEVHTRIRLSTEQGSKIAPVQLVTAADAVIRGPLEGDDDAARAVLTLLTGVDDRRALDRARAEAIVSVANDLGPAAWGEAVRRLAERAQAQPRRG
jgi:phage recombination protein Bet